MYILFWLVELNAMLGREEAVPYHELADLLRYTKMIADICGQNSLGMMRSYFSKVFEDADNIKMMAELDNLVSNNVKMSGLRMDRSQTNANYVVSIHTPELCLWTGVVGLSMKNEYILKQINFGREIKEILDCIEKNGWVSGDIDNGMCLKFYVESENTCNNLTSNISCLFHLMKDISGIDHNKSNDVDEIGGKYEDKKSKVDNQMREYKSNNYIQQSLRNDDEKSIIKSLEYAQSNMPNDVKHNRDYHQIGDLKKKDDGNDVMLHDSDIRNKLCVKKNNNRTNSLKNNNSCGDQDKLVEENVQQADHYNRVADSDHKEKNKMNEKEIKTTNTSLLHKEYPSNTEKIGNIEVSRFLLIISTILIFSLCIFVIVITYKVLQTDNQDQRIEFCGNYPK